jgi:hypothetical protein
MEGGRAVHGTKIGIDKVHNGEAESETVKHADFPVDHRQQSVDHILTDPRARRLVDVPGIKCQMMDEARRS